MTLYPNDLISSKSSLPIITLGTYAFNIQVLEAHKYLGHSKK